MLIVNPQWVTEGNVVSDLGFLPWAKKANEELVASFQEVRGSYDGGCWPCLHSAAAARRSRALLPGPPSLPCSLAYAWRPSPPLPAPPRRATC